MKLINKLIPSVLGVMLLTACSSEVANADTNVAQAEADILAAQIEMDNITKLELPFVGQLYFDFVGANATMMGIKIDKKGHTTIEGHTGGMPSNTYVLYEGQYSPMMRIADGESYYTIVGKNAIAELDGEGKLMYGDGCSIEEGKPCVTNLFVPD
ncbi:hypothetical protein [Psychrobacter sp. PAMC 21119]|uniref:hypothetical protein n=1 Tax=Psychrobacter sp. PAMC 21119 TaxID=1112209 RepID=UPI000289AB30|nr:hypothetical protein [Psychrobacter sp. PAMC 21119]